MINPDPVIRGYSRSVIIHLIKELRNSADEAYQEMRRTTVGDVTCELLAMRKYSRREAPRIRILARLLEVDLIEFLNLRQIEEFLSTAEMMLENLTPKE